MSASGVGTDFVRPNFEGTKSSGDMNIAVLPPGSMWGAIGWQKSKAIVIKPKSVRQARGGLSLDMRMFVC